MNKRSRLLFLLLVGIAILLATTAAQAFDPASVLQRAKLPPADSQMYLRSELQQPKLEPVTPLPSPKPHPVIIDPGSVKPGSSASGAPGLDSAGDIGGLVGGGGLPGGGGSASADPITVAERSMKKTIRRLN